MTSSTLRFLQQENIRLKNENEALGRTAASLYRYLETVQALYWAGHHIVAAEQPLLNLDHWLQQVLSVVGATDGSISRLDQATNQLMFVLVHGDLRGQLAGHHIPSDTGIAGWVVSHREALIVNKPRQDWRFSLVVDEQFDFLTQSIVTVPILHQEELLGLIQLLNKPGNEFTEADVAVLLILGQLAGQVFDMLGPELTVEAASSELFSQPADVQPTRSTPSTSDIFSSESPEA